MNEIDGNETCCAYEQTHHVGDAERLELREHDSPKNGTHRLRGENHAHPVSGGLVARGCRVGSIPAVGGYGAVAVGPHIHECRPAEELHQSNCPEGAWSVEKQLYQTLLALALSTLGLRVDAVEFGVLLRIHFLHFQEGIEHADDEYGGAAIEAPHHGWRDDALRGGVCDSYPGKENREEVANQAACVAEQRLDGVGLGLLLLTYHISNHHLERLHGHVDGGVEEDQGEEAEPHRPVEPQQKTLGEIETAGVRKHKHHEHRNYGSGKEVRLAPSHPAPGPVGPFADEWLDYHSHQGWKYPEEAELMRICTEGCEYPADVRTLEGISYLHSEKSEAQIPHLPEGKLFVLHFRVINAAKVKQRTYLYKMHFDELLNF